MTQPPRTWNGDPILSVRGRFAVDEGGYVYQQMYGSRYCGGPEVLLDSWDIVGSLYRIQLDGRDNDTLQDLIDDYEEYECYGECGDLDSEPE